MKADLTAIDWPPRADDPAYVAHLEGIRAIGDFKALNPCHFTGTRGLAGLGEDALGHLYHGLGARLARRVRRRLGAVRVRSTPTLARLGDTSDDEHQRHLHDLRRT